MCQALVSFLRNVHFFWYQDIWISHYSGNFKRIFRNEDCYRCSGPFCHCVQLPQTGEITQQDIDGVDSGKTLYICSRHQCYDRIRFLTNSSWLCSVLSSFEVRAVLTLHLKEICILWESKLQNTPELRDLLVQEISSAINEVVTEFSAVVFTCNILVVRQSCSHGEQIKNYGVMLQKPNKWCVASTCSWCSMKTMNLPCNFNYSYPF